MFCPNSEWKHSRRFNFGDIKRGKTNRVHGDTVCYKWINIIWYYKLTTKSIFHTTVPTRIRRLRHELIWSKFALIDPSFMPILILLTLCLEGESNWKKKVTSYAHEIDSGTN